MRNLLIALAVVIASVFAVVSLAEEKIVCIEFNGQQFCEAKTVIHIGDKDIPIDDPFSLLDSISGIDKVNFWAEYDYPRVISELARQLKMPEDELIYFLRDADENWKALYELTTNYYDIKVELNKYNISNKNIDDLFEKIIKSISEDIKSQLKAYEGVNI